MTAGRDLGHVPEDGLPGIQVDGRNQQNAALVVLGRDGIEDFLIDLFGHEPTEWRIVGRNPKDQPIFPLGFVIPRSCSGATHRSFCLARQKNVCWQRLFA